MDPLIAQPPRNNLRRSDPIRPMNDMRIPDLERLLAQERLPAIRDRLLLDDSQER